MSATMNHTKPLDRPIGVTDDGMLGKRAMSNLRALERIDAMPPALRQCVHEFGLPVVDAFKQAGITDPSTIRHLVREVWAGARSSYQSTTGGTSEPAVQKGLDWLLIQAGAQITAAALVRFLWDRGQLAIVPTVIHDAHPATQASMATVATFDQRVTKARKHSLRLTAGIKAAAMSLWPVLRGDG